MDNPATPDVDLDPIGDDELDESAVAADETDPEDQTILFEDALDGEDPPTDAPAEG